MEGKTHRGYSQQAIARERAGKGQPPRLNKYMLPTARLSLACYRGARPLCGAVGTSAMEGKTHRGSPARAANVCFPSRRPTLSIDSNLDLCRCNNRLWLGDVCNAKVSEAKSNQLC